jgi:hypothetical protein
MFQNSLGVKQGFEDGWPGVGQPYDIQSANDGIS